MPAIGRLVIEEGTLAYRDAARGIDLDSRISTATGEAEDAIRRIQHRCGSASSAGGLAVAEDAGGQLSKARGGEVSRVE